MSYYPSPASSQGKWSSPGAQRGDKEPSIQNTQKAAFPRKGTGKGSPSVVSSSFFLLVPSPKDLKSPLQERKALKG